MIIPNKCKIDVLHKIEWIMNNATDSTCIDISVHISPTEVPVVNYSIEEVIKSLPTLQN